MYPLTVRLEGKRVVVIGGGRVASFKIAPLLRAGADVIVISKELDVRLVQFAERGKIRWLQKEYERSDIFGAFLVVAATNDSKLNEQIADDAESNQLVNVITNPEGGNVHFPAAIHRGKLNIAVSTGGASPKLAKKIRDQIAQQYNEHYEEYLQFLYEVRLKVKGLKREKKQAILQEVLDVVYIESESHRQHFLQSLDEILLIE
ncbi:NAD(P)-binding protein [Bacillus manliponensis]|uniref:NAD(P)-binding protein n=1 Tax=Bacillus manliponensis TaxID=574376 RepID=UPI00351843CA